LEDILIEAIDIEPLRNAIEVAVGSLNYAQWLNTISHAGQSMQNGKSAGGRLETEDGAAADASACHG
jgi:hypothetical protein